MKIIFIVYHTIISYSGISKKILSEIDGLRACGAQVDLCRLVISEDGSKSRMIGEDTSRRFGTGLKAKLNQRTSYSDIIDWAARGHYDAAYIRYDINSNPFTTSLVRSLRKLGMRVIVEIPTWPYDGEFAGQSMQLRLMHGIDKVFRKGFFRNCDRVVLFSGPDSIFGTPVTHISNGIDFGRVPLLPHHEFDGTLRLLSVANIHLWHGLDRLLKGMAADRNTGCELHIVGDGLPEIIDGYRALAEKEGIADRVKILGPMYGEDLDREFMWADMAVGSLGRHRSGITSIKTLKNREYAARGFAFFFSEDDSDFNSTPYTFKIPGDESPVDIKALTEFYKGLEISPEAIRESIADLSWEAQMRKVIASIS